MIKLILDKKYTIRKSVLNMPLDTWDKINKNFKDDHIILSINEALNKYNLISGNSSLWNKEEKEFFDEEYKELRKRR